ncbi:MAG: response regulator [Chitinivibrionales bacterium]
MDKNKRILLIDDEEVITFGFSMVLKEPGVELDCANTLEEAQQCINAHLYDAAIIDLRLSNSVQMEGFDCIRLLRSRQPGCRIIVMTAFGDNGSREKAKELGADLFFEKPMEPETVKDMLKTLGIFEN